MPSPLNVERLSQVFCGIDVALLYPATELFALVNGCAAAGSAVPPTAMVAMSARTGTRMNTPSEDSELTPGEGDLTTPMSVNGISVIPAGRCAKFPQPACVP